VKSSFAMSVRLSVRMEQLSCPLDGFSLNVIFEDSSKICRENSSFTKLEQQQPVLHMQTDRQFVVYHLILLIMTKCFGQNCREAGDTHFVYSNFFSRKSCLL